MCAVSSPARPRVASGRPVTRLLIPQFEGVVLAGGASARMGTDKATVEFDGEPLFLRSARALAAAGATRVTVIGGSEPDAATGVEFDWIPDERPGNGPLAAVLSALDRAGESHVAVLSCDLPAIRAREVLLLGSSIGDADVALPVIDGHRQWMTSLWSVTAESALTQAVESGERRVWKAASSLRTAFVFDYDTTGYTDVDTPDDLHAANTLRLSTQGRVGS